MPVFINRTAQTQILATEKDACTFRHAEEGTYITLKLLTGARQREREDCDHFLPKNAEGCLIVVPREGGLLADNRIAKQSNVEGWDPVRLERLIEAAAVGAKFTPTSTKIRASAVREGRGVHEARMLCRVTLWLRGLEQVEFLL